MKTENLKQTFKLDDKSMRFKIEQIIQLGGAYLTNQGQITDELLKLFNENDSLEKAKAWAREKMLEDSVACPLCKQKIFMWRRKINSIQAAFLVRMAYLTNFEAGAPIHYYDVVKSLGCICTDYSHLFRWGLIAADEGKGMWHITEQGLLFVNGKIKVSSHCFIYNDKVHGFAPEQVDIFKVLGSKFTIEELLSDRKFTALNKKKLL